MVEPSVDSARGPSNGHHMTGRPEDNMEQGKNQIKVFAGTLPGTHTQDQE